MSKEIKILDRFRRRMRRIEHFILRLIAFVVVLVTLNSCSNSLYVKEDFVYNRVEYTTKQWRRITNYYGVDPCKTRVLIIKNGNKQK